MRKPKKISGVSTRIFKGEIEMSKDTCYFKLLYIATLGQVVKFLFFIRLIRIQDFFNVYDGLVYDKFYSEKGQVSSC